MYRGDGEISEETSDKVERPLTLAHFVGSLLSAPTTPSTICFCCLTTTTCFWLTAAPRQQHQGTTTRDNAKGHNGYCAGSDNAICIIWALGVFFFPIDWLFSTNKTFYYNFYILTCYQQSGRIEDLKEVITCHYHPMPIFGWQPPQTTTLRADTMALGFTLCLLLTMTMWMALSGPFGMFFKF